MKLLSTETNRKIRRMVKKYKDKMTFVPKPIPNNKLPAGCRLGFHTYTLSHRKYPNLMLCVGCRRVGVHIIYVDCQKVVVRYAFNAKGKLVRYEKVRSWGVWLRNEEGHYKPYEQR